MNRLPTGVITAGIVFVVVVVFVAALALQNWTVDLLLGLAGVVAALLVISRPGAHA